MPPGVLANTFLSYKIGVEIIGVLILNFSENKNSFHYLMKATNPLNIVTNFTYNFRRFTAYLKAV